MELIRVLISKSLWMGPGPVVAVLFLALNVGTAFWHGRLIDERKRNLTTGDTEGLAAGTARRYDTTVGEDLASSLPFVPDATKARLVVLSGMSQMYTINDRKPGEATISEWMDDATVKRGTRVFGLAAPNLCNEEALFLLLTLLERRETTPHVFLYGSCFDKYRNVDLRPGYAAYLASHPTLQSSWDRAAKDYATKYPAAAAKMASTRDTKRAIATEETAESRLRAGVSTIVPLVEARKDLNSFVSLQAYFLRNWAFGIKATSKRPIIRTRYDTNREFLGLMSDVCAKANVTFATYVIPLNPQAENPYVSAEYAEFKTWLEAFCRDRNVPYANLEGIVPNEDWGEFNGGPDFKHFRGAGHRATADTLVKTFGPVLEGTGRP